MPLRRRSRNVGAWLPPSLIAPLVNSYGSWAAYSERVVLPLIEHMALSGYRMDLTLSAPWGTWRPGVGSPEPPGDVAALAAGRRRRGPSGRDPIGLVAYHPEAAEWARQLGQPVGDPDGFVDATRRWRRAGLAQLTLYVGGYCWLPVPSEMILYPATACDAGTVSRIVFDAASSVPTTPAAFEFLSRSESLFPRLALEGIRQTEASDLLSAAPFLQTQAAWQSIRHHLQLGDWYIPDGYSVRAQCADDEEVDAVLASGRRHLPLLMLRRTLRLPVDW